MRRVARWGLVAILLFISAAFGVLAAQFAAGSAPRWMFGAVAIALVLIVAALLAAWFRSPARRMSAIELARQDAAELLRKRGSPVVSREDHA
jgi:membrane protein YdbS with pleckstrin-like domain